MTVRTAGTSISKKDSGTKPGGSLWLDSGTSRVRVMMRCLLVGLPCLWLSAVTAWIRVEYYDGLDAICVARFFTGEFPAFLVTRAPLMGAVLAPVRLLTRSWNLHPLAVGPYHVLIALLHSLYLIGIYAFFRGRFGETRAVWAVFVSAILNVVFFSYAPFLSHDILPGGMLVVMLILAERFADRPSFMAWMELVCVGTCAALLKQTYGLFWLLILVSRGLPGLLPRGLLRRTGRREWLALGCGAALSGLVYWLLMGWVLHMNLPDIPYLLRPYRQMVMVGGQYAGTSIHFPVWVYLRNIPFYGLFAAVLVIPGLWQALRRGDRFSQALALVWLGGILVMHLTRMREVRYLAFLMPLTAYLGITALTRLEDIRQYGIGLVVLLGLDIALAIRAAAQYRDPFYHQAPQRQFCDLVCTGQEARSPVFYTDILSFMPSHNSPFAGDRYHRLFHVGPRHLQILYGVPLPDLRKVAVPETELATAAAEYPAACLYSSQGSLYYPPRLWSGPPAGIDRFAMAGTLAERICSSTDGSAAPCELVSAEDGKVWLRGNDLGQLLEPFILPCLKDRSSGRVFPIHPVSAVQAEVAEDENGPSLSAANANWELWGFRIRALAVPARERSGLEYLFFAGPSQ